MTDHLEKPTACNNTADAYVSGKSKESAVTRGAVGNGDLPDDADALAGRAIEVLAALKNRGMTIATAESCTGGLLASLLTDQEGLGQCFDRAFVTYTDDAKHEMLGVDPEQIRRHGAVSAPVAVAMAKGGVDRSRADLAVAITGFAGPAGEGDEEGLVHLACAWRDGGVHQREYHLGAIGREAVRARAASAALELVEVVMGDRR